MVLQDMRHEAADVFRSKKRQPPSTPLDDTNEAALQVNDEDGLSTEEQRRDIFICLDHLTEVQRDMMILHYYAQLQPKEIAFTLGLTPEAVRKRLHDAHSSLRKIWAKLHEAPEPDHETLVGYMEQGMCPQDKIALKLGAALPALLGSTPTATELSRAGLFLKAAHNNDANIVLSVQEATKAGGVLTTKILVPVISLLIAGGLGVGAYTLTRANSAPQNPPRSAPSAQSPQQKISSAETTTTETKPQNKAQPVPAPTPNNNAAAAASSVQPAPVPAPQPQPPTITVNSPWCCGGTSAPEAHFILADQGLLLIPPQRPLIIFPS
jgi:predicted DNA-binding protein YlxM (UPF0122 family)